MYRRKKCTRIKVEETQNQWMENGIAEELKNTVNNETGKVKEKIIDEIEKAFYQILEDYLSESCT